MHPIFQLRPGVEGPRIFSEDHRRAVILGFFAAEKSVPVSASGGLDANDAALVVLVKGFDIRSCLVGTHSPTDECGVVIGHPLLQHHSSVPMVVNHDCLASHFRVDDLAYCIDARVFLGLH